MEQINTKIIKTKFLKLHIDISENVPDDFILRITSKSTLNPSKNEEENKVCLTTEMKVFIPESEDLLIDLISEIIFEFDEKPIDFQQAIEDNCIPLSTKELFNKIDDILIVTGYPKLNLNN